MSSPQVSPHLTDEQLGARLDGALAVAHAEAVERHLAGCAECRARLAELTALDGALAGALAHDPGEEYFATFAQRVSERIAGAAPVPAAKPARGLFAWWSSPRALAWAGGALGACAAVALVVVMMRDHGPQDLLRHVPPTDAAAPAPAEAPSGPAPGGAAPHGAQALDDRESAAPQDGAQGSPRPVAGASRELTGKQRTPAAAHQEAEQKRQAEGGAGASDQLARRADARNAPLPAVPQVGGQGSALPGNVVEMKTLPNGEQVAVQRPDAQRFPQAIAPRRTPTGFVKPGAQPLGAQSGPPAAGAPAAQNSARALARDAAPVPAPALAAAPAPAGTPPPSFAKSLDVSRPVTESERALGTREEALGSIAPAWRVCGEVVDARGRSVAGATLSIAETGASTTAGADGGYCLAGSGEAATLEVFAVGFRAYRAGVTPAQATQPLRVTLLPVETLAGGAVLSRGIDGRRATAGAAQAAIAANTARSASAAAARANTLAPWQRAADAWAHALALAPTPAAALDARFHVAEAHVQAWRHGHTTAERAAAVSAVTTYLAEAPASPLRQLAENWRKELAQ